LLARTDVPDTHGWRAGPAKSRDSGDIKAPDSSAEPKPEGVAVLLESVVDNLAGLRRICCWPGRRRTFVADGFADYQLFVG